MIVVTIAISSIIIFQVIIVKLNSNFGINSIVRDAVIESVRIQLFKPSGIGAGGATNERHQMTSILNQPTQVAIAADWI